MKAILLRLGVVLVLSGATANAQNILTNAGAPALTGPGVGVQTFTAATPGNYPSLSLGAITFSGPSGVRIENLYAGQFNSTGNYLNNNNGTNGLLTLTFGAPMAAFGFNYGASDDPWTLSAYDAGNNLIASTVVAPIGGGSNGEFIGIASTNANIAYATFKDNGGIWFPDWVLIDNVKFTEVPLMANSGPVDCNCVANLPGLTTNGCPAYVPDLCALAAGCFSTNMLPGSCLQNPPAGSLAAPGTNLISLAVLDSQSNFVFCPLNFVVIPPPNPVLTLTCASNKTVECGSGWMFDEPVVTTTCCDPFMTVNVVSDITNGVCPKIITRTWFVTNSCGLSASCSQTVTNVDTTPPTTMCAGVNLVPNGNFEFHTACPWTGGQIGLAAPWFDPTDGTSDYCNSCASIPQVSTPTNAVGVQIPLSGQGYAGIFVFGPDVNIPGSSYREYMEVPLLSSLVAGQTYRVSFYVSRAEKYAAAIAEIGAHFSSGPIVSNGYDQVLNFVPQVVNASTNLLISTTAWMQVQGTFTAAGGENYLTLGNFLPDGATTAVPASGIYTNSSHYYFDNVSVEALCPGTVTNKIVQCGSPWSFDAPVPYDQCSGTNVAVSVNTVTNGVCPMNITRTWTLTDLCGNTSTWSQTVSLVNTNPPIVICTGTNLVPNADFESFTNCPVNGSELAFAAPWYSPSDGTSDYYNTCATLVSGFSVPTNFAGVQTPFNGQGYAGAYQYYADTNDAATSYREYLQTPLLAPLVAGRSYTVSFHVSRSDNYAYAIADIGAYFSVGPVTNYIGMGNVIQVVPQVVNPSTNLLSSTNSWMLIQGTFTAAGGEDHLTLGNFRSDAATTAVLGSGPYANAAYYYFDAVSVTATCQPTNKIVPCGIPWSFDPPVAIDACSGSNATVSVAGTVTNSVCPLVVLRTWNLVGPCSNTTTWTQTVSVVNNGPLLVNCACLQDTSPALLITNACTGVIPNLSVLTNSPCISNSCGTLTITQSPAAGTVVGSGYHFITNYISNCSGSTNICVLPFLVNPPVPVITCPANIYAVACTGAVVVNFSVAATGNNGPVICSPPSGSAFPLGTNAVICTATNNCGGTTISGFYIIVRPPPPRFACFVRVIGIINNPPGLARPIYLPDFPGGGMGVDFDIGGSSGPDGARLDFGPAEKFAFSTFLDFNAPDGASLNLALPPDTANPNGTPLLAFTFRHTQGLWEVKGNKGMVADTAALFRSVAIGTNGELFSSFTQDAAVFDTNVLLNLSPMAGATGAVMTVTLDCRTRELTLEFPSCAWTPDTSRKGWDGCIYGNHPPRGSTGNQTARLILTPLATDAGPPITTLELLGSNLGQIAFDNPSITVMGRKWSDGHVAILKAYDDGVDPGIEFFSFGDGGGVSADLGHAASFRFSVSQFQGSDVPNQSQLFSVRGWPPGTTTNRPPPPVFNLRLAQNGSGTGTGGIDCSAEFLDWGVSNVTVQLWNGTALVGEILHAPAALSSALVTLGGFPETFSYPTIGTVSLASSTPLVVLGGLGCSSRCTGTELRIIAELPSGATPPVAFAGLDCFISQDMDNLISGLQTTPACSPVPLNVTPGGAGLSLSWQGDGFRLYGAESLRGSWYDLGVSSPVMLPTTSALRFFRLLCD